MGTAAIEVRDLRKTFTLGLGVRKRMGLAGMSFDVQPGEVYGFLGPNGAGKTTSIKVLTGLLRQDSGEAAIFGKPPSDPVSRRRLGFLPESPVFYDHLTGREFLHFCGKLCGLSGADLKARSSQQLKDVGLDHAADLQIRRYSKGMTQRIGIAQALLHDPDVVILDEPMSGLDPMGRADMRDIILKLKAKGKTIFFSTHIIPDVEVICTRVGIVHLGKSIRVGTVRELLAEGAGVGGTEILCEGLAAEFKPVGVEETLSTEGRRLFVAPTAEAVAGLLAQVLQLKGAVISINRRQPSLEDLVVKLIEKAGT